MEPVFEIRNTTDPKALTEYYGWSARGVKYVVCAATGLALVFMLVIDRVHEMPNVLFTGIMAAIAAHFTPHLIVWLAFRSLKKEHGDGIPESVITVSDAIRIHQDMSDLTVEYSRITRVKHLKNSYLLLAGKSAAILLDPNSFTKGTFSEFKQFLREKRPDLIIPE